MSTLDTTAQLVSISVSLLAAGSILTMSLFDIPELNAQPASRSLPALRWLFSRGSHIMPPASLISSASFTYLAYSALPASQRAFTQLLQFSPTTYKSYAYLAAAALTFSIAPFTMIVMVPTNFEIIKQNESLGGARSEAAAEHLYNQAKYKPGQRSAEDSVNSKGEGAEFTDLSGPQTETSRKSSRAEDERARELLSKFGRMNSVRGLLMAAGGIVGLWAAVGVV